MRRSGKSLHRPSADRFGMYADATNKLLWKATMHQELRHLVIPAGCPVRCTDRIPIQPIETVQVIIEIRRAVRRIDVRESPLLALTIGPGHYFLQVRHQMEDRSLALPIGDVSLLSPDS